jgi:hypothetical protein
MKCLGHLSVAACYYIVAPLFKKNLPLFIEVPVPRQESEQSCIYVLMVSMLPLSTILYLILELL